MKPNLFLKFAWCILSVLLLSCQDTSIERNKAKKWVTMLGWTPMDVSCVDGYSSKKCLVTALLPTQSVYSVVLDCESEGCAFRSMTPITQRSATSPSVPLFESPVASRSPEECSTRGNRKKLVRQSPVGNSADPGAVHLRSGGSRILQHDTPMGQGFFFRGDS